MAASDQSFIQMRAAGLLFALLLAPAVAAADCGDDATQSELNACAAADYDAADAELNRLYHEMRARLEGADDTTRLLTLAQRAWIGWRDTECDLASASVAGGSIYPMIRGQCLARLTTARAADFRRYLACEEGDLSCPLPPQ
jgi:uncharacterized protein YecT (DUF1311 family)